MAPNTVERMFELHRDITRPKKSGSVASIVHDLEVWEGELEEYYRVGGVKLDERTKLLTAHAMLPDDTSPMIRLMIKGCLTFDSFNTELRNTIKFLGQYDCLTKGRSAVHAVEEQPVSFTKPSDQDGEDAEGPATDVVLLVESMCREGRSSDDIAAAVRSASNMRGRAPFGAQRQGNKAQSAQSRQRARTPPRDPKDQKCANCNEKGHTHLACPHPAKPMEKRICHECGGEGHTACRCPNKGKTGSSARLAIADRPSIAFAVRDVIDEEGVRPVLKGAKICELPMKV